MATILSFKPSTRDAGSTPPPAVRRAGEIVLFPGVRYERWGEPQAAKPKKARRSCRDKIELQD